MKEILALHQKVMALPEESRPESGVNFFRAEEDREGVDALPAKLQGEGASLHRAINDALPEDFDSFFFVGLPDEEPAFHLEHDRMSARRETGRGGAAGAEEAEPAETFRPSPDGNPTANTGQEPTRSGSATPPASARPRKQRGDKGRCLSELGARR